MSAGGRNIVDASGYAEAHLRCIRGQEWAPFDSDDPILYRNTAALIRQALHFGALAPNMIVKISATTAGIAAFEEVTYWGLNVK
jgi:hypothetical protein